ncbi:sodium:solute symporter family protein [Lyticum sinuosum]|uniref:Sodium:solute symporter family protein n=1 Tax=Lyticum sinuosum TaxID=1332059 RepID=A0AAE4VMD2_9RICK|nr:sodium:solute symporter family protein [Lyticum sinuosum]MDZ5761349.1 Sodium:solute symporter family protein [Lyticum sinuosum]
MINLDLLIIISYIISIFFIGLYYGKNTKTILDYTVANKKSNKIVLSLTLIATVFGAGSIVGDAAKVSSDGIIFIVSMTSALSMTAYVHFFADKFFDSRFDNMISAGDLSRYFYGRKAEQITAIFGILISSTSIGGQLTAVGHLFSNFFENSYDKIVILSSLLIIIYVSIGGVKSIAMISIVQSAIILSVIPIIAMWLVNKCGGISNVIINTNPQKLAILTHSKFKEYSFLFFCSWLPFLWLQPSVIQRFLMTKNKNNIKSMYNIMFFVRICFSIAITITGLCSSYLFPDINSKNIISAVIKESLPIGLRGLFIIAVLSASISTADSALNAASILLVRNIIHRNKIKKYNNHGTNDEINENHQINTKEKINENDIRSLILMRLFTIIIGSIAMFISLYDLDIIELMLIGFSVWGSGIIIPIVGATIKMPNPTYSFYIPSITTLSVCILSQLIGIRGFYIPSYTVISGLISYILCIFYYKISNSIKKNKFN